MRTFAITNAVEDDGRFTLPDRMRDFLPIRIIPMPKVTFSDKTLLKNAPKEEPVIEAKRWYYFEGSKLLHLTPAEAKEKGITEEGYETEKDAENDPNYIPF